MPTPRNCSERHARRDQRRFWHSSCGVGKREVHLCLRRLRMETVVGIFRARGEANQAMDKVTAAGISREQLNLLSPHSPQAQPKAVAVSEAEPPGVGKAIG